MAFPITEEELAKTEKDVGRRFPESFRKGMLANNGGMAISQEAEWELHPFRDTSDRKRLSRTCNHIIQETAQAREWRGFPSDAVAVANNGFGDRMIFCPSSSDAERFDNRVFAYWHETGEVTVIADDFSVFERE